MTGANLLCRLCYIINNDSTGLINIYSENNLIYDCERKISKYLYLQVSKNDEFPNSICWSCLENLETFHKFYEKINQIQKNVLKDRYDSVLLKAIYHNSTILLHHGLTSNSEYFSLSDRSQLSKIEENSIQNNVKMENELHIELPVYNEENREINTVDNKLPNKNICPDIVVTSHEILPSETNQLETAFENLVKIENIVDPIITNEENNEPERYMSTRSKTISSLVKMSNNKLLHLQTESVLETDDFDETNIRNTESDDDFKIEFYTKKVINRKKNLNNDEKIDLTELIDKKKLKRKRGRPKLLNTSSVKRIKTYPIKQITSSLVKKNKNLSLREDIEEGESDNEFPARDSDNDDWPAQQTLNAFPDKILENGLLLVKGKKLMSMICKFYKLECDLCFKDKPRFRHLRQLFKHYSENHKEDGYVTCCQTKLCRYPAIIMHMARHIQPDAFKCNVCGYMVTRPRFLESHQQTHLPEEQKPFGCNQCPRRFCWKGALQIHQISHQPVSERKLYVCHICGKIYDTPGGLSTHKLVHTDRKQESHVCHICAKKFATRTGLNEHMATIHQPREKDQVQCTECGKWLMNNRCLKSHMVLHSSVVHECRICDYSTKKPMLLRRHLLTQHSDAKPFSCQICDKSFKLKRALTVHVAQHSNTKSYKCTFCERVFASSTNFYTHRKNMHPHELQAMKDQELEDQRQKRIKAGIETEERQLLLESGIDDGDVIDNDEEDEDDVDNLRFCETDSNKIYTISLPVSIATILNNNHNNNLNVQTTSTSISSTNPPFTIASISNNDIVRSSSCSSNIQSSNNDDEASIIVNLQHLDGYL